MRLIPLVITRVCLPVMLHLISGPHTCYIHVTYMLHLCYVDAIGSSPGVSLCTQELESEGTSVSMSDQNTELVST